VRLKKHVKVLDCYNMEGEQQHRVTVCCLFLVVLGFELRASCLLGEPYPRADIVFLILTAHM
jgi:hypothetical protein